MPTVPKPFPKEFRDDVVRVARSSEASVAQVPKDSNRIVGYSIDSPMKARLAVQALDNAVARRAATGAQVAGCIVHADRGSQFRSRNFHRGLARHGMVRCRYRDRPAGGPPLAGQAAHSALTFHGYWAGGRHGSG